MRRSAGLLLLAVLCIWLAGATVPFVAMTPAWTSYIMTGTTEDMTGSAYWSSASFEINDLSCFMYLSGEDNQTVKITVFNSTGNNDCNLTYDLTGLGTGGSGSLYDMWHTFQTTTYNSTHQLIAIAIWYDNYYNPYGYVYLKLAALLCDGSSITLLYNGTSKFVDGFSSTHCPIMSNFFMTDLVTTSYGIYAMFHAKEFGRTLAYAYTYVTRHPYLVGCFTHDYLTRVTSNPPTSSESFYGYPGVISLADEDVYFVSQGLVICFDTTTDSYTTPVSSSVVDFDIDTKGTQGFMVTSYYGTTVTPTIYFQGIYTTSTPSIKIISACFSGSSGTVTYDTKTLTGLKDAVYYNTITYSAIYVGFVAVNTTGGTNYWVEVIPSIDSYGNITALANYTLGAVESPINAAQHYRWSLCWLNTTTGYPDWANGYYTSASADGSKYYKASLLGSYTLVNSSQSSAYPQITGSFENETYTADSNETRIYDRVVSESYTNQNLTALYIYLDNINSSLQVGAYYTASAGAVSSSNPLIWLNNATVSAGWYGWVSFTNLSYAVPQNAHVAIVILPTNTSVDAFYSIGVPVSLPPTDVYNTTGTVLPPLINSTTLVESTKNKAVAYSITYSTAQVAPTIIYGSSASGSGSGGPSGTIVCLARYLSVEDGLGDFHLNVNLSAAVSSAGTAVWTISAGWIDAAGNFTELWTNNTLAGNSYNWILLLNFTPASQQDSFYVQIYRQAGVVAGDWDYNVSINSLSESFDDTPTGTYNLTFLNEFNLTAWSYYSTPWAINVMELQGGGGGFTYIAFSNHTLYTSTIPQCLKNYVDYTSGSSTTYYWRQHFITSASSDEPFYIAPNFGDVAQMIFNIYDYTGYFSSNANFTACKIINGTYHVVDQGTVGMTQTVALYLTYGYQYYIVINGTNAAYFYGLFTPISSPVSVPITYGNINPQFISYVFERLNATHIQATFSDPNSAVTWVNVTITNTTGYVDGAEASASILSLVTSPALATTSYWATYNYTSDGYNFTQVTIPLAGQSQPYSNWTVVPPVPITTTIMGVPVMQVGMMIILILAGTIMSSYYIRYGIIMEAGLLVFFAGMGWIPALNTMFAAVLFIMALLFVMGMKRGRA